MHWDLIEMSFTAMMLGRKDSRMSRQFRKTVSQPWAQQPHYHHAAPVEKGIELDLRTKDISSDTPANGPGRRIGGLKPWKFWSITVVISLIVVGASVGGGVGASIGGNGSGSQQQTAG
jgi:hypothetical protein